MKTTDFINSYNEDAEYDDEAGMVKNNLHTIIRVSTHLERAIGDNENMPEWCQEKIAQVKGMIVSVMDYMISQHEMGKQEEIPGFNPAAADVQMSEMLSAGSDRPNPVTSAITRRIMMQRIDLLQKYGPELVGNAIDEVADYVGDWIGPNDEIGSSDVSGWVAQVERMLANNPPEAFGLGESTSGQWKVRSLSPDDSSWGVSRSVKTADGKFKSETHAKKFSSQEAAEAAAKKLNGTVNESGDGSFIITAKTAEGKTKKFRVNAANERAAVEKFTLHHNQAEIVKVTQQNQPFGSADNWLKDLKIREDATGGAVSSSSVSAVVKELGEEGMTRKQVNKKLGGYTNISTKPKAVKVKGAY